MHFCLSVSGVEFMRQFYHRALSVSRTRHAPTQVRPSTQFYTRVQVSRAGSDCPTFSLALRDYLRSIHEVAGICVDCEDDVG